MPVTLADETAPVRVERYGRMVYEDTAMDFLRKTWCLCLRCAKMRPGTSARRSEEKAREALFNFDYAKIEAAILDRHLAKVVATYGASEAERLRAALTGIAEAARRRQKESPWISAAWLEQVIEYHLKSVLLNPDPTPTLADIAPGQRFVITRASSARDVPGQEDRVAYRFEVEADASCPVDCVLFKDKAGRLIGAITHIGTVL